MKQKYSLVSMEYGCALLLPHRPASKPHQQPYPVSIISILVSLYDTVHKRLDWPLRGKMEAVRLEWEVHSAGTPYQRELGLLGSWRSEKRSKEAIVLAVGRTCRKHWNNKGIPKLQNGRSTVKKQLHFISYEWVDHIAVTNYMFRPLSAESCSSL
jgi:hypothetical protein